MPTTTTTSASTAPMAITPMSTGCERGASCAKPFPSTTAGPCVLGDIDAEGLAAELGDGGEAVDRAPVQGHRGTPGDEICFVFRAAMGSPASATVTVVSMTPGAGGVEIVKSALPPGTFEINAVTSHVFGPFTLHPVMYTTV